MLDAVPNLDDLLVFPGNRLEALKGYRAGQHSIWSNDRWRICFIWRAGDTFEVEIVGAIMVGKTPLTHPARILLEELLEPLGLSQYLLAKDIRVPARRINEIVHGKRTITADTALRLGKYFNMSPDFWLNLQTRYDLEKKQGCLGKPFGPGGKNPPIGSPRHHFLNGLVRKS